METAPLPIQQDLMAVLNTTIENYPHEVLMMTVAALYNQGKLKMSKAAAIVGMDKWEFAFKLKDYGYPIYDYTFEQFKSDMDFINQKYPANK